MQVAARAESVAVHVTVLVPTGKEPCSWLPIVVKAIAVLLGDTAVHATFTVPQLSVAVGSVNVTNVFTPVGARVMGCVGHCVKVGGVVSGAVEKKQRTK